MAVTTQDGHSHVNLNPDTHFNKPLLNQCVCAHVCAWMCMGACGCVDVYLMLQNSVFFSSTNYTCVNNVYLVLLLASIFSHRYFLPSAISVHLSAVCILEFPGVRLLF